MAEYCAFPSAFESPRNGNCIDWITWESLHGRYINQMHGLQANKRKCRSQKNSQPTIYSIEYSFGFAFVCVSCLLSQSKSRHSHCYWNWKILRNAKWPIITKVVWWKSPLREKTIVGRKRIARKNFRKNFRSILQGNRSSRLEANAMHQTDGIQLSFSRRNACSLSLEIEKKNPQTRSTLGDCSAAIH